MSSIGERDPDDYPMGGEVEEEVSDDEFQFPPDPELERVMTAVEPVMPALYHHCTNLFTLMAKTAEKREEGMIWTGSLLTTLTQELGLGNAHYTAVTRKLKEMGCMRQLRRGGGPQPSIWILYRQPTPGLWRVAEESATEQSTRVKAKGTRDQHGQQLRDMNARLLKLERLAIAKGWPL
jgi:hypothetical protein